MHPHRQLLRAPAIIRPGRDDDAPWFIALIARCWADYEACVLDVDAEAPELRALDTYYRGRGGALWLASDDGHCGAGMIATAPDDGTTWEICRVYVHPDLHGTGLGPALLRVAERHAVAAGARRLMLWTDTRFERAHRFYVKHGYQRSEASRALGDLAATVEHRYVKQLSLAATSNVKVS